MRARRRFVDRACVALALAILGTGGVACDWGATPATPTIIAQGFDLNEIRETRLGEATSMRVRIEVPGGVESLRIRERSFDADLALSPEASHYPLFGLERRVWSKTDVTLDFGPYLVSKISSEGDYAIDIQVTDSADQTVGATLRLLVLPSRAPPQEDAADAAPVPAPPEHAARTSRNSVAGDLRTALLAGSEQGQSQRSANNRDSLGSPHMTPPARALPLLLGAV